MQQKQPLQQYWTALELLLNEMKKQYPLSVHAQKDPGYKQAIEQLAIACTEGKKLESYGMLGALGLKHSVDSIEAAIDNIGPKDSKSDVATINITGQASCALAQQFIKFIPAIYELHAPNSNSTALLKSGWASKLQGKLVAAQSKVAITAERISSFQEKNPAVATTLGDYKNPYPQPVITPANMLAPSK